MTATQDRAEDLVKRIGEVAKELLDQGMKSDAFGMAAGAVLAGQLVKALDRIERLEGDIRLLTDLLASVEGKQ
ncbi:hypothetical protein D9M68_943240 [compost metagenome]